MVDIKTIFDTVLYIKEQYEKLLQRSLKELLKEREKDYDAVVTDYENKGFGEFIAGKIIVQLIDNDNFEIVVDFYFKTKTESIKKVSCKSGEVNLSKILIESDQQLLRKEKFIEYDYERAS